MTGERRRVAPQPAPHAAAPHSGLWYSDREIGLTRTSRPPAYETDDFRRELARVERNMSLISALCILAGTIAAIAIVWVILSLLGFQLF